MAAVTPIQIKTVGKETRPKKRLESVFKENRPG